MYKEASAASRLQGSEPPTMLQFVLDLVSQEATRQVDAERSALDVPVGGLGAVVGGVRGATPQQRQQQQQQPAQTESAPRDPRREARKPVTSLPSAAAATSERLEAQETERLV